MNPRLALLLGIVASWLLVIVVRLYDLQVTKHQEYSERAERQQQRVVVLDAPRGTIRDARGRELAVSVEVRSVAADPKQVENAEETAVRLAEILGLEAPARAALLRNLKSDRRFVWVKRKPDRHLAERVEAAALDGVFLLPESKRYYPLRKLAAHVLGYVGTDNVGLGGLEALYDKVITSRPGHRVVVQDGLDGKVLYPNLEVNEATPGVDLELTLDAGVQHIVERELAATLERTNARRGSVVVLEPHTGAVLAMASLPTFDPNRFHEYPQESWRNQVVADAFEPGSTFKMVTLSAALERGAVGLDDVFDCLMGSIVLHGTTIRDHHPFGLLTARQVLAKSSNVGAMKIGFAAGREAFYQAIRAYGFGRPTGIDLPGESAGLLRELDSWSALTPAYVAFGQGMSATPIQLARAFAAVANGGRLVAPHVVARIGERPVRAAPSPQPVAAPSTIAQLTGVLEGVVTDGTATAAAIPGYRVAGKTGTAQKAIAGRGYAARRFVASFIGMVPVERPALVIAVVVDEPWPLYHGSQAAAPAFASIAGQALLYLGIAPQRERRRQWPGETPGDDAGFGDRPALRRAVSLAAAGAGAAADDTAPAPVVAPGTLPDFVGLSKRLSVREAGRLGLRLALHGHGYVHRQLPPPGTALEEAAGTVELWLEIAMPAAGAP